MPYRHTSPDLEGGFQAGYVLVFSRLRIVGMQLIVEKHSCFEGCGMHMGMQSSYRGVSGSSRYFLTAALVIAFLVLSGSQPANALPAFARKYGLRCSACHESWPMLNYFGQKFKDNGYQLMNDKDSPIWQNPSYWPITFRIIPFWHRESTDKVPVDAVAGSSGSALIEHQVTSHGFDVSGLDFHTGGTLEKNYSFYVLPSSDPTGAFHFETVMAR